MSSRQLVGGERAAGCARRWGTCVELMGSVDARSGSTSVTSLSGL